MTHGRRARIPSLLTASLVAAASVLVPVTVAGPASVASAAPASALTIQPVNARSVSDLVKGQPIDPTTKYTWLITGDDTGTPSQSIDDCVPSTANPNPLRDTSAADDGIQSSCQWPSIRTTPGNVPVIASGDQATLSASTGLPITNDGLKAGKYLISLLADGYALGGTHFSIPIDTSALPLKVPVQPYPLPLGTMKIQVFHDNAPVDATYEVDAESSTPMPGFEAHLSDVLGEVTTDWFGNPLCTNYVKVGGVTQLDSDGSPVVDSANPGGRCVSDSSGLITIPNLGSNRYGVTLSKPAAKQDWVQTTTLEGTHDHDVWLMNGDSGLDSELIVGGEPVPWVQFGYVDQKAISGGSAKVTGQVLAGLTYVGGNGGVTIPGGTGTAGGKEGPPIDEPWISLSDLGNGDQNVYTGRGKPDGTFSIANVPNGTYQMTAWDDNQDYILYSTNIEVSGGKDLDTGKTYLSGWVSRFYGTVFIDSNGNGTRDDGEQGVPGTAVTLRERDNSLMDQMSNLVTTNSKGEYSFTEAYPLTRWLVLEHFNTRFEGTGITFQGENDPKPTTIRGNAVDVNVLPILGLGSRIDWGVRPYPAGTNGGIVGTVTYDTTRNELDPAYSVTEDYQPGVPGITLHLYPVRKDANGDPILEPGSLGSPAHPVADKAHELADPYVSETWEAPKGCTPRQWDGTPLNLAALPGSGADTVCIESPADGQLTMPSDATDGAFGQTVNGNYGFTESDLNLYAPGDPDNPGYPAGYTPCPDGASCAAGNHDLPLYARLADFGYDPQPLSPDDYVVTVDMPKDAFGKDIYQATREQDVNVFDGDNYLPQDNFPFTGTAGSGSSGSQGAGSGAPEAPPSQGNGPSFPCVGPDQAVHVTNSNFADGGGSPFEGDPRPLCTEKLITVHGGQAVAPNFNLFTQTPLPTHFWGLTINDLGLSWDKRSIQYGEAQGIPNVPMGVYDWSGNLVDTTTTDFNGFYEAIEPSTSSYNCPLPAGPCAGMYRFVGNDPGQPGQRNATYNPRYRTISANFQAWPGLFTVTDTAPTMTGAVIVTPGTTSPQPVVCDVTPTTPEVFAVSTPVVSGNNRTVTVTGQGFGSATAPVVQLLTTNDNNYGNVAAQPVPTAWSDRSITFQVPPVGTGTNQIAAAPYQLRIRNGSSQSWSSSAITVHVIGSGYGPTLRHVGPGQQYSTIQAAIGSIPLSSSGAQNNTTYLILVHPGTASASNPDGAYRENLVVNRRAKIQGYGPGGTYANGTHVAGSVIDGQAFDADGATGTAWFALAAQPHTGPDGVADGATVTVLPRYANQFAGGGNLGYATLDGLRITGGYQQDVNANLNTITGANVTGFGAPGATVTQGGGVYVHASATGLRITNDLVIGNSGTYGGGIRVGTPYVGDNANTGVRIGYDRIRDNGGTNLAGGIGIFTGATSYSVDHNDICGNFSAEYGGAMTHFGVSANGVIDHNRMWFNESYDEGGAAMVAGELPANPDQLSTGSGPVTISNNEIVANNANDDGGGVRLLQVNDARMDIFNNIIADNLSTHEGGGVALDDAINVRFVNNTVARNITTATAVTSDGTPAPAGLSTGRNSVQLQVTLAAGRSVFSNPILRNNVFWENMAGTWDGKTVTGIGLANDNEPANFWDMGAADGSGALSPTRSVLTTPNAGQATDGGATVPGTDVPLSSTRTTASFWDVLTSGNSAVNFVNPYSVGVDVSTLRTFPGFRQSVIVVRNAAPDALGNYHLNSGSTAVGLGVARWAYTLPWFTTATNVDAPRQDIDGNVRYTGNPTTTTAVEAGADERP